MPVRMFIGDCRSVLATLPDASVQMVCKRITGDAPMFARVEVS